MGAFVRHAAGDDTAPLVAPRGAGSTPGGWCVEDATGMPLAYVYGDDPPEGVNQRKLTRDEARRIAAGIARIPERQGRT